MMRNAETRQQMLDVAADYDRLALRAEEQSNSDETSPRRIVALPSRRPRLPASQARDAGRVG
jgi:hypothetical protein